MKSNIYFIFIIFALGLSACSGLSGQIEEEESLVTDPGAAQSANPSKDLIGNWDIRLEFLDEAPEEVSNITFQLNEVAQSTNDPTTFAGTGCMLNSDPGTSMPVSFQASYDESLSTYSVTVISTLMDSGADMEASPIRFQGSIVPAWPEDNKSSAEGAFATGTNSGNWSGIRQSTEKKKCAIESGMEAFISADMYVNKLMEQTPPEYITLFNVETLLAVNSVEVKDPEGKIITLESYTDFWTPDINFVTGFRFLANIEGEALQGGAYVFAFYDILGNPIEGLVFNDAYLGCEYGYPTNISAEVFLENEVRLSWEPPVMELENKEGVSYQIILASEAERMDVYGAGDVMETYHILPWETFESGEQGNPDGSDFGVSMGDLEDGVYKITVAAWYLGNADDGEIGSACSVYDNTEDLVMEKSGDNLIFPK